MRTPTRFTLAAISLLLCACAARAQQPTAPAFNVSPEGEGFVALMPRQPASDDARVRADGVVASGRRYEAAGDDASTYAVWSLTVMTDAGRRLGPENYTSEGIPAGQVYLDLLADFAWDLLVRPEFEEAVRQNEKALPSLSLRRIFELGGQPAREYTLSLKGRGGPVYVCADGPRAYVVAAFGPGGAAPQLKQFVESFNFKGYVAPPPKLPAPGPGGVGEAIGPGSGGIATVRAVEGDGAAVNYDRTFKQTEVTRKAIITYKPEPSFTEAARRYTVTGVVRIRGVLNRTGEVTNLNVVKWLPHGLTQKALDAARRIRFTPADKDGHAVSQYIVFEYNFNIY
ncbi:MAG TPA: energy transducer TonB [Pyrinomonadaceae bacterium]|nr:energy transducer TonB [Pyrinomonadaceae bacterium]